MKMYSVLLLFLVANTWAAGQTGTTSGLQPNTVLVGADGKFDANPDTALLQFSISVQKSTSSAAYDQASKDTEQVRQILRSNSIEPNAAEIGYFSFQPVYDYNQAKRKLVAYQVNVNVSLKLKDFTKIAPITQQLSDASITDDTSVSYLLDDTTAAKAKAVEDAYRRARESADAVAHAGGRTLGEMLSASVDVVENRIAPLARPMAMAMKITPGATPAPTEEFTPQTISVSAHVNALFALK